ncbi:MAG: beta-propeller domain-containing protein [Proteobacteria bacterium]|nr:beta-propeller domain-containing protein [Pseudomonadota bacterium]
MFKNLTRTALVAAPLLAASLAGCDNDPFAEFGPNALRSFRSCDEVNDYMGDVVLETLVRSRYGGYWGMMEDDVATADGGESSDAGPTDYTTTNVQEAGVDELDIVKTDGQYIYVVEDDELIILDSWPIEDASIVSRVQLDGWARGLFLDGDNIIVFNQRYYDDTQFADRWWGGTQATFVDITDRANPETTRKVELEGWLTDARMIDGEVYPVLNTWLDIPQRAWELTWDEDLGLPEMDWNASDAQQERIRERARDILRPHVRRIMAGTQLEDMLPLKRDTRTGDPTGNVELIHECTDLYRPNDLSQHAVLSLLHFPIDGEQDTIEAAGIVSDGWTVYASQENLYVAQTSWWSWWGWGDLELETHIHKFDLGEGDPTYVASGTVDGWLWNQFAMSEYDGYFRVATTTFDWWWGTAEGDVEEGSNVFVLQDDNDGSLEQTGSVEGLAPGEQIRAVRMMGEKGYVVTFEQIDPLFTIDLSDPHAPEQIGELELPGFSAYLHPLGDDHLLAVGMAGDWDGNISGLAVTVFDVSDFANPRIAQQLELGTEGWAWSEALWDHHAFTYHRGVLSIPATTWQENSSGDWDYFSGLYVISVDENHIEQLGTIDHRDLMTQSHCYYDWEGACNDYWYASLRRSVYIEDNLFSLSNYGVKVNDLNAPDTEHTRVLFNPLN